MRARTIGPSNIGGETECVPVEVDGVRSGSIGPTCDAERRANRVDLDKWGRAGVFSLCLVPLFIASFCHDDYGNGRGGTSASLCNPCPVVEVIPS